MYTISIEESFSASHALRNYPGPCSNIHGHNYKVIVCVEIENLNELGLAIDFHDLQKITMDTISILDHRHLNELEIFSVDNPSAENIAKYVYNEIREKLPTGALLKEIGVEESKGCKVTYSE